MVETEYLLFYSSLNIRTLIQQEMYIFVFALKCFSYEQSKYFNQCSCSGQKLLTVYILLLNAFQHNSTTATCDYRSYSTKFKIPLAKITWFDWKAIQVACRCPPVHRTSICSSSRTFSSVSETSSWYSLPSTNLPAPFVIYYSFLFNQTTCVT